MREVEKRIGRYMKEVQIDPKDEPDETLRKMDEISGVIELAEGKDDNEAVNKVARIIKNILHDKQNDPLFEDSYKEACELQKESVKRIQKQDQDNQN